MAAIYYEYTIKGDEDALCAYLDGFLRGKGIKEGYFFTKDHPFQSHQIKEMIKYHGAVGHLICQSKLRQLVQSAIRQDNKLGFEVKDTRKIKNCSFHFEFETANRTVAGTIKRALAKLVPGVDLIDYDPEEVVDPKAKGPEGYAPLHSYTFKGAGLVEGDIAGVLKTHTRLSKNEFIDCEDIEVHH